MKIIHSLLGRRQFLIALISSILVLVFNRLARAFNSLFHLSIATASDLPGTGGKKTLKGIVVYYSATGSTGKVAGAIYEGMGSVIDCDVAPVDKINPEDMAKYDVVAIGSPIWYYRETANVRQFIYNMPHMEGKLCALFCTHGTQPDGIFFSISQPLFERAFTVIGWNDWYGGCSHVLHQPKPYHTDGHPDYIDLREAQAFGREIAERSIKIYSGERKYIPEIPTGPDADPLWIDHNSTSTDMAMPQEGAFYSTPTTDEGRAGGPGEGTGTQGGMPAGPPPGPETPPRIDLTKCVYPRCTACIDNCIKSAIDLSVITTGGMASGAPILVKEACILCSHPLCQRACYYDAIIYDSARTEHVIHMDKCTYPECTLCEDKCPMDAIDFSQNPPVFHNTCEGCDLCWCICPEDAIEITNLEDTHMRLKSDSNDSFFFQALYQAEKEGRFRRLVPLDEIGWDNIVYQNPSAPRVVLNKEDYPYNVKQ